MYLLTLRHRLRLKQQCFYDRLNLLLSTQVEKIFFPKKFYEFSLELIELILIYTGDEVFWKEFDET